MKATTSLSLAALALGASAQKWTNPDGGNTNANIGDTKIAYGYTPPWYALDKIKEECPTNGCNSENKIEYSTGIIQDGEMKSATITLSVEGSFNDEGEEGNRDQLVEIVKAVAGASKYDYDKDVIYHTGNGCSVSGPIPCDPGNEEHADQYSATNLIVVRVEDAGGSQLADMSVSIRVDVDDVGGGVCEAITTIGGAMAGAINGIAGGIFTLAGLGCG